jgi:hypothetical protein
VDQQRFDGDPDSTFYFDANLDPDQVFIFMPIRIRLSILMSIWTRIRGFFLF